MDSTGNSSSLVVYTVLLGQKAELNPPPLSQNADYVCLTDQTNLNSNGWKIRNVESIFPEDIPRSSRHAKINTHLYFKDYSRSIYVDSSVLLLNDPELLWSELVDSEDVIFGVIAHSFHVNMLEELEAVSAHGFETNEVIMNQLEFNLSTFKGYLSARPMWGGILARRHNDADCKQAMELWFSLVLKHSRRDQLSLPLALRALRGNQTKVSYLDNRKSDFFRWPVAGYSKPPNYSHLNSGDLQIAALILSKMDQLSVNGITSQRLLSKVTAERDAVTAERDAVTAERDALLKTKVWRWTKGLRSFIFRIRTLFNA